MHGLRTACFCWPSLIASSSLNTVDSCLPDDTGCPSSQSVSPVKTPSDSGNSPVSFRPGSDEDFTRKKCTIGMAGEGSIQSARYKKEPKSGLVKPGKYTYIRVSIRVIRLRRFHI